MTYPQALKYLESFINYEKITSYPYRASLKLERIKNFLQTLGNPQDYLKCIHIAGTKGKGSTCAFIAYILREAGYRVGLYTSPHLSDFRERIRILNHPANAPGSDRQNKEFEGMISKKELAGLVGRLKPLIERYNRNSIFAELSFFEVYTSLAFIYFKEKKVDFAVLETGLGGRLDATNVVDPLVCAITTISYEHTQKLGNTLKEIAAEKAGIIKNRSALGTVPKQDRDGSEGCHYLSEPSLIRQNRPCYVISAPQEKEAIGVIRRKCKEADAKLFEIGRQIQYETNGGKDLRIKGIFKEYPDLRLRLLGQHQLVNATLAVSAIEGLRFSNINVGVDAIRKGLYNTLWPGRCEVVAKRPLVILDGAQNIASAKALAKTIPENFKYKKLILVLGISKDKDIKGICSQFYDLADEVILTKADNPRASEPESLAQYFSGKDIYLTTGVKRAIKLAKQKAKEKDLVLITGSLFVVGEARKFYA